MVEILCLSAEITAGLLIMSIVWDRAQAKGRSASASSTPSSAPHSSPISPKLFEKCLHLYNRLPSLDLEEKWLQSHRSSMRTFGADLLETLPATHLDRLTGVRNKAFLENTLGVDSSDLLTTHGSIALFDIDGLKGINDEHGMDVGDLFIKQVTQRLNDSLVERSYVVRLEGGKLVVLLPSLDVEQAALVMESLRKTILSNPIELKGKSISSTLSSSIMAGQEGIPLEETLRLLDEGLHLAKSGGRDRLFAHLQQTWSMVSESNDHQAATEATSETLPESESSNESVPEVPPTPEPESLASAASAGDIEALFASVKPNAASAPDASPASADDIEALLANANKSKAEAKPAQEPMNPTEAASSGDIEALFASMKGKPATPADEPEKELLESIQATANEAEQVATSVEAAPATEEGVETKADAESVSTDDIEALFAAMKGKPS